MLTGLALPKVGMPVTMCMLTGFLPGGDNFYTPESGEAGDRVREDKGMRVIREDRLGPFLSRSLFR